jgi:hypothetical protein
MSTATTTDPRTVTTDATPAATVDLTAHAIVQLGFAKYRAIEAFGTLQAVEGSQQPLAVLKEIIAQIDRVTADVQALRDRGL